MENLSFPFPIVIVFRHIFLSLFKTRLKELSESHCLVSICKLFHCLSVDGRNDSHSIELFWCEYFEDLVHF